MRDSNRSQQVDEARGVRISEALRGREIVVRERCWSELLGIQHLRLSRDSVAAEWEAEVAFDVKFDHPGDDDLRGTVFMPFAAGESGHDIGEQNVRWTVEMGMLRPDGPGFQGLLKGGFEHLATLVYRDDAWEDVALATNFITFLFVLDDMVDSEVSPIGNDSASAVLVTDFLMQALCSGELGEPPEYTIYRAKLIGLANALVDVHERLMRRPASIAPSSYYASMRDYFDGVVSESRTRCHPGVNDLDDYAAMRLQYSAVLPCFELGMLMRGLELSDELRANPAFRAMQQAAVLSVSYINDLFSYRKEFLAGERSNLVMVLERSEVLTREQALARACEVHTQLIRDYQEAKRTLPAYDTAGEYYITLMEYWMRGNLDWMAGHRTLRYCEASSTDIPLPIPDGYEATWSPADESGAYQRLSIAGEQ